MLRTRKYYETRYLFFGLLGWTRLIRIDALSFPWTPIKKSPSATDFFESSVDGTATTRVLIVGGGIGGLATASRIASLSPSSEVIVLEKNSMLGGRCGSFDVDTQLGTFRHERGPSLLLLPQVYQELFQDCSGVTSEHYGLTMKQCVPAYQVVFDDGDIVELGFPASSNSDATVRTAERESRSKMDSFEENGASKWDAYMASTAAFLDCGLPNFIEERFDLSSFPAFLQAALWDWGMSWPLKPHSDVLDATFSSNKMRALASFQNLYVGLEPYRNDREVGGGVLRKTAPAVFGLLAAIELHPSNKHAGVFAPVGGFCSVTEAFRSLAEEKGVKVRYQTTVTHIEEAGVHVQDTREQGGESTFLSGDLIVVNADLPFATQTLLSAYSDATSTAIPRYDWNDQFDFSCGVISFHWSVDKKLEDLNTHNVFLIATSRSEAHASWRVVRDPSSKGIGSTSDPFNFYVHRASNTDASAAPDGCDSLLVLVPCQVLARNKEFSQLDRNEAIRRYKEQFDDATIDRARQAVLQRLEALESLADLGEHIVDEVVDTPGQYADLYNVAAGTPFAMSHGIGQLSLTRPGHESKKLPNVLFVGASTRPGNGVPLVLIGAKQVADKAIRRLARYTSSSTRGT